ncbi:MAG: hypothetical protein P8M25_10485, partial [Paracoccaceae bacterium]|nr:hypothetical protein [Paracoccaceae bacterium]
QRILNHRVSGHLPLKSFDVRCMQNDIIIKHKRVFSVSISDCVYNIWVVEALNRADDLLALEGFDY